MRAKRHHVIRKTNFIAQTRAYLHKPITRLNKTREGENPELYFWSQPKFTSQYIYIYKSLWCFRLFEQFVPENVLDTPTRKKKCDTLQFMPIFENIKMKNFKFSWKRRGSEVKIMTLSVLYLVNYNLTPAESP